MKGSFYASTEGGTGLSSTPIPYITIVGVTLLGMEALEQASWGDK